MASKVKVKEVTTFFSTHRTGRLAGLGVKDVTKILGFKPERDYCEKVDHEWRFEANGHRCAVWDYYGAKFSVYGAPHILREVFGDAYHDEGGYDD